MLIACAILVNACTTLPRSEAIASFGNSADVVAPTVVMALRDTGAFAPDAQRECLAEYYVKTGVAGLTDAASGSNSQKDATGPCKVLPAISPEVVSARASALKALSGCGSTLQSAADVGVIDKLETLSSCATS